ncbi:MAG: discoidin domain-containing protein [Clostridia bacterium]|nr:discoidin domain-containing protein [Clostridia bacterium]
MSTTKSINALTDWFSQGKYGIMMHFLGDYHMEDAAWDEKVNAFDCDGLAAQLHECGVNHLLFTISQCGGRFCMPIEAYATVLREAGFEKKLCSDRDLVADLIKALDRYGISLMLYAAVEGPISGELNAIFPWDSTGGGPGAGFTEKYFPMLRELSLRYGKNVKGWWIDGCYDRYPQFKTDDTEYLRELTAVLKAGNPDAILAYNPGILVKKVYAKQEYTCGEANQMIFYPEDRMIDGAQWHVLTYLGSWWSDRLSTHSNIELVNYTKACTDKGGVLTFDVAYGKDGLIVPEHFDQLRVLKRFIKDTDHYEQADIPESEDYLNNIRSIEMDDIPNDYINIALGKPCTASSSYSDTMPGNYFPECAVDGDLESGWAPGFDASNGVWWQVDLGTSEPIDAIEMYTRQGNPCERRSFEIRASDDPTFATYAVLYHQGDFPLPFDKHWAKLLDGSAYRYVRLQVNGRFCIPFISEMRVLQKQSVTGWIEDRCDSKKTMKG